jgi:hypothetical protein
MRTECSGRGRGWRRLPNEEFRNLYASPNITRVTKSNRMVWAGHETRIGEMRNKYNILIGKPEGERPLGRPRRNNNVILEWSLAKQGIKVRCGLEATCSEYRPTAGCC